MVDLVAITSMDKQKLTQSRLKELLDYNPLTGIFRWKISKHKTRIGRIVGTKSNRGYIHIELDSIDYTAHRLAWFYVYGKWPKDQLDHEDHVPYHNWISNLREATGIENMQNKSMMSNNTSGFTGVSWDKSRKKWRSAIKVNDKVKHLGRFVKKSDAIKARKAANVKYGYHENHGKAKC